jgi:hypothetical protein
MASHTTRDFCGLLSKALDFFHQPLVVGMMLFHRDDDAAKLEEWVNSFGFAGNGQDAGGA